MQTYFLPHARHSTLFQPGLHMSFSSLKKLKERLMCIIYVNYILSIGKFCSKEQAAPYDARVSTTTDFILSSLNAEQRKAVEHTEGPTFILAGAGSGKTRALTHRIAYLIHKGIPPWQILAVTFTNKAAKEMKERIQNLLHVTSGGGVTLRCERRDGSRLVQPLASLAPHHDTPRATKGDTANLPVTGTFHSICVRILRRDIEHLGRDRNFVIYDTDDQEKLMKEVFRELKMDETDCKVRPALAYIGRFKAEALGPKEVAEQATNRRSELIAHAYTQYQKKLRTCNALDFDDLILEVIRLFHECPDVLARYQRTWQYLHVDEYQDTNHAQYLFATLLAKAHRNLCIIGDPDQSIYGFRGADIRNILEFQKEYPDAFSVKLEQNYRSVQPILTAADTVITANPNRPEKKMWTDRAEGSKVILQEVESERTEADETIHAVEEQRKNGLALNEQVILYRTNAQSRLFEEACMRRGLPYRIVGGFKFYARGEVKDVLAYLHVLQNTDDAVALLRILNVPSRKIGAVTLGRIQAHASKRTLALWKTLRSMNDVDGLEESATSRKNSSSTLEWRNGSAIRQKKEKSDGATSRNSSRSCRSTMRSSHRSHSSASWRKSPSFPKWTN
ncbi:UvrD-helicase domain-containing protein [Candidatus Peregrinibacteria bacterium]|nr:UvrD-helicase domain-containing protein [Candidatus Peregrinibacteria bacterium]